MDNIRIHFHLLNKASGSTSSPAVAALHTKHNVVIAFATRNTKKFHLLSTNAHLDYRHNGSASQQATMICTSRLPRLPANLNQGVNRS